MRSLFALVLVSALAMPAAAQEAEAFVTTFRPSPYGYGATGAGVSIAAFVRLRSIFVPEIALGRSDKRTGLRFSFARLWSDDWVGPVCYPVTVFGGCTPARQVGGQLDVLQAMWVIEAYRTVRTTVEVGGSAISYQYLGQRKEQTYGLAADLRASRRLTPAGRWWRWWNTRGTAVRCASSPPTRHPRSSSRATRCARVSYMERDSARRL